MKSLARTRTAPRSSFRRSAFAAALLVPALTACGFDAQTDQIYQAAQGADDRSTTVKILNAVVVAAEDGSGTFAGSFVNEADQPETLTSVTAEGITAEKGVETITVAPNTLLNLGNPVESVAGGPDAEPVPLLVLVGSPIEVGRFVRLTFEFSGAGKVTVNVPVVSPESELGTEFTNVPLPPGTEVTEPAEEIAPAEEGEEAEGAEGGTVPEGEEAAN